MDRFERLAYKRREMPKISIGLSAIPEDVTETDELLDDIILEISENNQQRRAEYNKLLKKGRSVGEQK